MKYYIISTITGIILIVIGFTYALSVVQGRHAVELAEMQATIDSLEADKLRINKSLRSIEARHLTTLNGYRVEVKRLEAVDIEWEFYTGVYAGCIRFFFLAEAGYAPAQIEAICNEFTKDHYGLDMYHWPGPPGIDRSYIEGRVKGRTS